MQNEILVKKNANLDDTIKLIVDRVKVDCNSEFVNVLCQKLYSTDPNRIAFLKRLFDCVHGTVKYQLDPEGKERVYRPERTIADGKGDCKKMTVIICSVLRACGIPCLIKHVFYSSGNITHVYCIVPYPCAKGYLTIDPVENKIFDNEVQYAKSRIFDLNGFQMDLYTGSRAKTSTFKSSFRSAVGGVMDDLNGSAGCPIGATMRERAVLDDILSSEPVEISGIGKKKTKEQKQQKKENRQEKRKKVANKFKQVGLAAPRLAFLGLVRINALKIASRLVLAWNKDKAAVEKKWRDLGGDIKQLKETIIKGSKQQISGTPDKIGVVAFAAAAAAAAPVLIAVHEMLKKLNVKGFTPADDEKLDKFVEDAEDKAADNDTKAQDIVDAAKGSSEDVPKGGDDSNSIPPAAPPIAPPADIPPANAPSVGGFSIDGMNLRNPATILMLTFKVPFYCWVAYEVTKQIAHQILSHF